MFEELYQSVKLRFGSVDASQSMGEWICNNTTIKKRPFSFEGYEFQRAIADDMHPNVAVKKCSQIGLTEVQIRKTLAMATRSSGVAGIFSMPNEKMFTKTYNGRFKPILEADGVFNPPVLNGSKPTRSKDQVQIRDSFVYITACTEGDATSLSADFLMHDELDLSPQDIIALYQSRVQGSDMQITQAFSTPTFANFGIDKRYKMSDQREYFVKCAACNTWQIPMFTPEFVFVKNFARYDVELFTQLTAQQIQTLDLEDCHIKCNHCHRRLDLSRPELREWVAARPLVDLYRGYQVRPFSTIRLKPRYIFTQLGKYAEDGFLRGFYNTVLGEEYTNADAQVQKKDVEACIREAAIPPVHKDTPVYLGVDVGMVCHITLSYDDENGIAQFFMFENIPAAYVERRINELREIYNIVQGAMDRFPYTQQANEIRDASGGVIVPIQYRGGNALQPVFEPDTKVLSHYSASNTLVLDRLHSLITHHRVGISGFQGQRDTIIQHLTDMVRDESPDSEATWRKNSGQDHYFHSMAFNLLARRVSEHLFASQASTIATIPSYVSATFGSNHGGINMLPGGNMRNLQRISGLG